MEALDELGGDRDEPAGHSVPARFPSNLEHPVHARGLLNVHGPDERTVVPGLRDELGSAADNTAMETFFSLPQVRNPTGMDGDLDG